MFFMKKNRVNNYLLKRFWCTLSQGKPYMYIFLIFSESMSLHMNSNFTFKQWTPTHRTGA